MGHEHMATAMINSSADSVLAGFLRRYKTRALGAVVARQGWCVHPVILRPCEAQTLIRARYF